MTLHTHIYSYIFCISTDELFKKCFVLYYTNFIQILFYLRTEFYFSLIDIHDSILLCCFVISTELCQTLVNVLKQYIKINKTVIKPEKRRL